MSRTLTDFISQHAVGNRCKDKPWQNQAPGTIRTVTVMQKKHSRLSKIYDDEALGSSFLIFKNTVSIGLSPLPVTVTTRIITFLVGDPNLNLHLPQESWEGRQPKVSRTVLKIILTLPRGNARAGRLMLRR